MLFLRVENEVEFIPDIDFLCTLGESTSRGNDEKIGQFGSGFMYTLALFARNAILGDCKICLGKDVYVPFIKTDNKKDHTGNVRVVSKIGLKKQNGGTYDLNVSAGFGEIDWRDVTMGVREIVSNAIDNASPKTFKYEIVAGNQCNAKDGKIRVYIPITPEINDYVDMLDKYFICIKPSYNENVKVLPKMTASDVIVYRKGVKVGSFGEDSLFDYNVLVKVDESRLVDKGESREACAKALLMDSRDDQLEKFINEIVIDKNTELWESKFDIFDMNPKYIYDGGKTRERFVKVATKALAGRIPCRDSITAMMIESKNKQHIILKEGFYDVFKNCGIRVDSDFLDDNEALGNTTSEPTTRVLTVLDEVWNKLTDMNLTNGREKPPVKCFNSAVTSGGQTFGYCKGDYSAIFIHENISEDWGTQLFSVMLEEVGHYITKSGDFTRDFQTFFVNLSARLLMK